MTVARSEGENLRLALYAFAGWKTESRIAGALLADPLAVSASLEAAPGDQREAIFRQAAQLEAQGVGAVLYGDPSYPKNLIFKGRPAAPVIFTRGNRELLGGPGVGMCGARNVSDLGLRAANACGFEVSEQGFVIISGYAKGVDTETHLAALRSGGSTVIVLAEGIDHFSVKRAFRDHFDPGRVLVLSQFPPTQPWSAHAAMTRNKLIYGLGMALVVIEAGSKGGTLAAGQGALRLGRSVFVLNFGEDTPAGNLELLANGGRPITSRKELAASLKSLAHPKATQDTLPL